jgi:hypothetical protein
MGHTPRLFQKVVYAKTPLTLTIPILNRSGKLCGVEGTADPESLYTPEIDRGNVSLRENSGIGVTEFKLGFGLTHQERQPPTY